MKAIIDLEKTAFDFNSFLRAGGEFPRIPGWDNKGKLCMLSDFGTVFIGLDRVTNSDALSELFDIAVADGPIFKAPEKWAWGHIAKAFGIFKSISQARKNGWSGSPSVGFNSHRARICKIRGVILVVRIVDDSPWVVDFPRNGSEG